MKELPQVQVEQSGMVSQDIPDIVSVLGMLPKEVAAMIHRTKDQMPDLFEMDESALYKFLRSEGRQPTPTDNRLRLNFWNEYERAKSKGRNIHVTEVCLGVCSREYFYKSYLQNPWKVSWLFLPPAAYTLKMEETLSFGLDQMREILSQNHDDDGKGKKDYQLMKIKRDIVQMIHNRIAGLPTAKTENKNYNVSTDLGAVNQFMKDLTEEEMEKRIRDMDNERGKTYDKTNVIEAVGKALTNE
jgi:hypothetical protein